MFALDIKNNDKVEKVHEFNSSKLIELLGKSFEKSNNLKEVLK